MTVLKRLYSVQLIAVLWSRSILTRLQLQPVKLAAPAPAPDLALWSTICCCKKSFEKIHFTSHFTGGLFNSQKGTSDLLCSSSTSLEGTD